MNEKLIDTRYDVTSKANKLLPMSQLVRGLTDATTEKYCKTRALDKCFCILFDARVINERAFPCVLIRTDLRLKL